MGEADSERHSRWGLAAPAAVALFALAAGLAHTASAEDLSALFRLRETQVLLPERDPAAFLEGLDLRLVRPVVVLTREDAVAFELLRFNRTMDEVEVLRTARALCQEAEALGWDPLLYVAVIHIESYYDPYAVSVAGAEGLMQLMPNTAEWMAERLALERPDGHSFDPELNVKLGTRYLALLNREFKRLDVALTAYNRGPKATRYIMQQHGGLPEAIRDFYATKVLQHYQALRSKYGHLPLG